MKSSEIIQNLIEEKGLTQKEFAAQIGVNPVTLSRNLKNDTFSHKTLVKIASTFDMDVNQLMPTKQVTVPPVVGYLEYNGEIYKIKKLDDVLKLTNTIADKIELMKVKQPKLPSQKPITIQDIQLFKEEKYDASVTRIESFRHGDDIVEGRDFTLGNMCSDYPFEMNGIHFNNSESAYIAGGFSYDTEEHYNIQKQLTINTNGFQAKKEYRSNLYKWLFRSDWETFNVQWMLYVVWCKTTSNKAFSELLRSVPDDTMIVENSTGMSNPTSWVWGCHNDYLEKVRDAKVELYKINHPKAKKQELNIERNRWNNLGVWEGKNIMGKILKICSICIKHSVEPPIDYDVLNNAKITLLGQALTFTKPKQRVYKSIIFDMDGTLVDTSILAPIIQKIKKCKSQDEKDVLWEEHDKLVQSCRAYDGIDDLLSELTNSGYSLGIITNSIKHRIEVIGKIFFPVIPIKNFVGRYSINRLHPVLKPDSKPYIKALELLGAAPFEAMYLGNSPEDILGANNAGLTSIACLWGAKPEDIQAIQDANPTYTINHPLELLTILQ